jgi:sugar phosphate isomerase/epimerase
MYPNLGVGAIGHKATLTEAIDFAQQYGFRGIDFSIGEAQALAEKNGVVYVRELFTSKGILPGVMGFPVEFRKDEGAWREGMAALPAQAQLAQAIGCTRSATWVPPGHNERDFAENFKLHVERIGAAAAILADHDIALGLEFIGPKTLRKNFSHRFIYTMEGMLAMGAAMGTGNVGLLLDVWHLYTSHGTLDQVRELQASDVVVVHINDAPAGIAVDEQMDQVRTLPGETGVLDIEGFLQALEEIGYDGPVTVEPFSKRVREMSVQDAVAATAASVQKVWPRSGVKAAA